jgi:hypothetical protein
MEMTVSPWISGTKAVLYHGPHVVTGKAAGALEAVAVVDRLLCELEGIAEKLGANAVVGLVVNVELVPEGYLVTVEGTPAKLEPLY